MIDRLDSKLPERSYAKTYKGNILIAFESYECRDPQFGFGKAQAIAAMARAGMPAATIRQCMVWVGVYKMGRVDPELMVKAAQVLVDFVEGLPVDERNKASIWHDKAA